MLRNIRSQSMLALLVVLAASASADNSVINPGFEQGETGWLLTSEKGVVGGAITEDGDGNHALSATGDIYSGLWYPIIIAAMTLVIGSLLIPETKDRNINN